MANVYSSTLIKRNVKLHYNFTRLMLVVAVCRSLILLNHSMQFGKILTPVKPGVDSNLFDKLLRYRQRKCYVPKGQQEIAKSVNSREIQCNGQKK